MAQLICRDLSFSYPGGQAALTDVSFAVDAGTFLVLCGVSGCGKTTLLRQLKPALAPHGARHGELLLDGAPIDVLDTRAQASRIGFVQQNPDNQIVTDKVWHELAFGLESLGCDTPTIRRRVAEMAAFFGIATWFHQDVSTLSGGQKQLLNLAAVMTLQPDILILDEPTSQLDPIAAGSFLDAVSRIHRELGTTILMTEHRLEAVLPRCDRVLVLDSGHLIADGTPAAVGRQLLAQRHRMACALPAPMQVFSALGGSGEMPVTIAAGRAFLQSYAQTHTPAALPPEPPRPAIAAIQLQGVWFRYAKDAPDVARDLSLTVRRGECFALLGGNGTGKTTTLQLIAGLHVPQRGRVQTEGRVCLLPQQPQTLFLCGSVREELTDTLQEVPIAEREKVQLQIIKLCQLDTLLDRHPYDLSGGEQQRLALAKVLLCRPQILLLDEPTKGLDAAFQQTLAGILKDLQARGVTILMVSHDIGFCARHADRCALFFDGQIAAEGTRRSFFSGNRFYTTAANQMARPVLPEAVTADELIAAFGGTPLPPPELPPLPPRLTPLPPAGKKKRPPLRRSTLFAALAALLLIPLTLLLGRGQSPLVLSLLILLEAMVPFVLVFEGRRPQARELVLLAVLCAIAVAGRAAFMMLPQFKPLLAVVIIAAAAFGAEAGFLVGAGAMLLSNLLLGQGPWTPYQMFAAGIIGFLAGLLCQAHLLPPRRIPLCLFGFLATIILYGGVMNPASLLMFQPKITLPMLLTAYAAGLPMDLVHGLSTAFFLWLAAPPFLAKLFRIRKKYGLSL